MFLLVLATCHDVGTLLYMTTQENFDQPVADELSWTPEARAIEVILLAEQSGEEFSQGRTRWLGRLLGVKSYDRGAVTEKQFEAMNKTHIMGIIDLLPDLREAAKIMGEYDEKQKLRIGLYLVGWEDSEIGEVFAVTKSAVNTERKNLADRIAGGKIHPQTIDIIEAVNTARVQIAADILGSAAVSRYVQQRNLPDELKPSNSLFTKNLEVYRATELLGDIEVRFISSNILLPEHKGLLKRHFLDTENEMTVEERNAIGPALKSLRAILHQEVVRTHLSPSRVQLYESVELLLTLVDAGQRIPQGRATYVKKYTPKQHVSDAIDLDSSLGETFILEDNKRLDIAFSWLFAEKNESPPAVAEIKNRKKRGGR